MKNIDIVVGSGDVRAYLKTVGMNHLAKAANIDEAKALIAKCSASAEEMITTAIEKVFGSDVQAAVEVGDDIVVNVATDNKKASVSLSELINGNYMSYAFIDMIKDVDSKLRA